MRIIVAKKKHSQKKKRGYFNIEAEEDHITYQAQYIGTPLSGIFPSPPVILASAAGPEYFVSNRGLQNPIVANSIRRIDHITTTQQFKNGGFNGP